jgi:hypothetical protein
MATKTPSFTAWWRVGRDGTPGPSAPFTFSVTTPEKQLHLLADESKHATAHQVNFQAPPSAVRVELGVRAVLELGSWESGDADGVSATVVSLPKPWSWPGETLALLTLHVDPGAAVPGGQQVVTLRAKPAQCAAAARWLAARGCECPDFGPRRLDALLAPVAAPKKGGGKGAAAVRAVGWVAAGMGGVDDAAEAVMQASDDCCSVGEALGTTGVATVNALLTVGGRTVGGRTVATVNTPLAPSPSPPPPPLPAASSHTGRRRRGRHPSDRDRCQGPRPAALCCRRRAGAAGRRG